jgi:hypothetical protein
MKVKRGDLCYTEDIVRPTASYDFTLYARYKEISVGKYDKPQKPFVKVFLVLSLSPKRKASLEYREDWNDFERHSRNVYYSFDSKLNLGQTKNQN